MACNEQSVALILTYGNVKVELLRACAWVLHRPPRLLTVTPSLFPKAAMRAAFPRLVASGNSVSLLDTISQEI